MKNKRNVIVIALLLVVVVTVGVFSYMRLTETTETSATVEELAEPTEEPEVLVVDNEPEPEPTVEPEPVVEIDEADKVVVLIDPGHGADDYGAPVNGVLEKNLVLSMSEMLNDILSEHPEVRVYMTRTDDSYPSRDERVEMARDVNAAFMVSIHCNSNESPDIHGTETYYSADAEDIAKTLHGSLVAKAESRDREPRLDSGYYIIRTAHVPTMIMEVGYLTNPAEFEKLITEEYQHLVAEGIADGVLKVVADMKK